MANVRKQGSPAKVKRRPATSIEGREAQLVSDAVTLAEQQMADGSISSQNLNLYLKMASTQHRQEREKLELENELLRSKIASMGSMQEAEVLYAKALRAFTTYKDGDIEDDDENSNVY